MTRKRNAERELDTCDLDLEPPGHLSESSKALWGAIVPGRARSPGRLALLTSGLEARDRVAECRDVLAREGLTRTTETTGVVHAHPLVKVEKEQRALFLAAWRDLSLGWDAKIDGGFRG